MKRIVISLAFLALIPAVSIAESKKQEAGALQLRGQEDRHRDKPLTEACGWPAVARAKVSRLTSPARRNKPSVFMGASSKASRSDMGVLYDLASCVRCARRDADTGTDNICGLDSRNVHAL